MTASTSRAGLVCVCGASVAMHFDATNRKLSCDQATRRARVLTTIPAPGDVVLTRRIARVLIFPVRPAEHEGSVAR